MSMKTLTLNSEHRLTLESVGSTMEAVVTNIEITGEEAMSGDYSPATITATLVPRKGYLYRLTNKKLKVSKTASVDVEVEPSAQVIMGVKRSLRLPPEAVGTYYPEDSKIVYKWEEEEV